MSEKKPFKTSFIAMGLILLTMLVVIIGLNTVGLFLHSSDYENNHDRKVAPENRMYEYGK